MVESISNQECPICFEINEAKTHQLQKCKHYIHQECLEKYLTFTIVSRKIPIRCPIDNCLSEPEKSEILSLVPKDYQQKLDIVLIQQEIINDPDLQWCPTPDCNSSVRQIDNKLQCSKCNKEHCFLCQMPYHEGECEEDANLKFAVQQNFKKCPGCYAYVEKMIGCNYISCICGCKWCFQCVVKYDKSHCPKCNQNHILNENNQPQILQNHSDILQFMEFLPEIIDYKRLLKKRQKLLFDKAELKKQKNSMKTDEYQLALGKLEFGLIKIKTDLYISYLAKNAAVDDIINPKVIKIFGGKKKVKKGQLNEKKKKN